MTNDELDEMTARATDGTLDEAEYDRLTDEAERNWFLLLADPAAMEKAMDDVFVPPAERKPRRHRKGIK